MTFEQIGYFLALAEEGSFGRAARRCDISQPSLSNAIRALEAALGAPLFERTATGSELTAFGREMHPRLLRLHHDRLRALEFAHATPVARPDVPQLQSWPEQARRIGKQGRRIGILALAALLTCATLVTGSPASAGERDVEVAIREVLPAPFRCSRNGEPALYCRHDNAPGHSMVLELASGPEGPSASLTYDYDDARRHQMLAIMRGFFIRLDVPADAFDDCISRSQWQPWRQSKNGRQILCYRVELGDRVTHDIFVVAADKAPVLAQSGQVAR